MKRREFLECESGVSLAEIIEVFLPRGWFLPVSPGTKFVTVGGALACDIHGKNHHAVGAFSNFVEAFDLLIASGETLHCSHAENPAAFWATVGGMGLTGIITRVRLRLLRVESAYLKVETERLENLNATLNRFQSDDDYQYSVAWIDCLATGDSLGRSVLMRGHHAAPHELRISQSAKRGAGIAGEKIEKRAARFSRFRAQSVFGESLQRRVLRRASEPNFDCGFRFVFLSAGRD